MVIILTNLIGCETLPTRPKTKLVIIDEPETVYSSELNIQIPPPMPTGANRTNCNMHNYRVKWQQAFCDTVILLKQLASRVSDGEAELEIPGVCKLILEEEPDYCDSGSSSVFDL